MSKLIIPRSKVAPHYYPFFERFYEYEFLFGGRGGAKSNHTAIKLLARMGVDEYMHLIYGRKWSAHIRQSQFLLMQQTAKYMGWEKEFKFNEGDMSIRCLRNGNRATAKGLDDPDKTKSLAEPTHAWYEEMDQITFEDFDTLNKAIRSPKTKCSFIGTFNTFIDESHWIRQTIFDQENEYELSAQFKDMDTYLNHSTYLNNPFIDQESYLKKLTLSSGGNEAKIASDRYGVWGQEPNDNPWLYAFDEKRHIEEVPFLPTYPIYLSFDFNKNPMTCSMWQMSPQQGFPDSFIHCIDEMEMSVVLHEFCQQIKAKYPFSPLFVTGDSSGNKEGEVGYESKHDSAYSMIKAALGLSNNQMHQNTYNLSFENSRILMNQMFFNYPNIKIHPRCKILLNDIRIARVKEDGKPHELLKDREKYKMDMFDNCRYFFQKYFQEFARSNYHLVTK